MSARSSSMLSDSGAPVVVTADTLKEAYRLVRRDYGADAVILGTRTVNQRQELGLGHERRIEVTVQLPGTTPSASAAAAASRPARRSASRGLGARPAAAPAVNQEIIREVERIEELVAAIAADHERLTRRTHPHCDNPLAETLIENGASPDAVETLLTRFSSETGADAGDRPAAVAWLTENLRASNCTWEDFYGCHAFLGDSGCGRTEMVLAAAATLQAMERRTLVLSLMPATNGDVRHLQNEAAKGGFDAAVIQKVAQLAEVDRHLSGYDVVLVDMPHLRHPALDEGGPVHGWLARNSGFHRHLVVPLDRDPRDMATLRVAARDWNCDWIALSRTDMTTRPAKMLDVLESVPVPVSLVGRRPAADGGLAIAQSDQLLDTMVAGDGGDGGTDDAFRPGVATDAPAAPGTPAELEVAW